MSVHKTLLLLLAIGLLVACEYEEPKIGEPTRQFQKFIGGPFKERVAKSIILPSEEMITLGTKNMGNSDNTDFYLIKTDNNGNLLWEREFGGLFAEEAEDMIIAEDGSLMLLGHTRGQSGNQDMMLIRTNAEGEQLDSLTFGEQDSNEQGFRMIELSDGSGFILGGLSRQGSQRANNLFYKINKSDNQIEWEVLYGNLNQPGDLFGLAELEDGNIMWTGNINAGVGSDGDLVFSHFDGSGSINEILIHGQNNEASERGYVLKKYRNIWLIAGSIENSQSVRNPLVLEFRYQGTLEINQVLTQESSVDHELYDLAISPDDRLMVTGYIESAAENLDIYLSKWNFSGNIIWEKTYGGDGIDVANQISVMEDAIYLAGTATVATNQSIIQLRTDLSGNLTQE